MVPLELSKDNNQYCKISVFMPNAGSINESVISVTNVGGDSFSVAVSMIRWNANKVFCKLINGTKISNINMYYTVDTERFCFYIKANWYAKIIVSRLGLVNTSKIESINAIPSGAIEVPISWRDKRYSTDLGGLIGTATASKNGLVPYYAGGVLSFQYGVKVSLGSIYRPFTCTISTYENAANTFIIAHINITGGSCAKALSRVGTVKIKYSASTKNIYIYNTTGDPIALQRLLNSVGREVTGFSQISSEPTESDLVDIPINALWFTDWFKWRKFNGTEL